MGFVINPVKFLHILITVFFGNTGQTDFQNIYLFILMVNLALQFVFLGNLKSILWTLKTY